MKSLYVIREKATGTYLTSQKFRHFSSDLNEAATFVSEANALKAIKGMFPKFVRTAADNEFYSWYADNQSYINQGKDELLEYNRQRNARQERIDAIERSIVQTADMEAVEVKLTLV